MIETGKINLSQVSMVQQAAREAKQIHKHRVEANIKKEILLQIQSKSKAESQARESNQVTNSTRNANLGRRH